MKGIPCYLSEWILRNLSHMPSFCYKETDKSLKRKIKQIWQRKPFVVDTDAKANDSNQHFELREIADVTLL